MATSTVRDRKEARVGDHPAADAGGLFNGGRMWIGQHAADGDILVFDPALSDPAATNLSFFSLTQFRQRVFPRPLVSEKIHEITDKALKARALKQYQEWPTGKAAHEQERADAHAKKAERQKQEVLERHRRLLQAQDIPYQGVRDTTAGTKRRRTRCRVCAIELDDFASTECVACGGVLCSCGACGCNLRARKL
jgi:hypothetical protein